MKTQRKSIKKSTTAIFSPPTFFSKGKKHGRPEKFYVGIVKPTRKTSKDSKNSAAKTWRNSKKSIEKTLSDRRNVFHTYTLSKKKGRKTVKKGFLLKLILDMDADKTHLYKNCPFKNSVS